MGKRKRKSEAVYSLNDAWNFYPLFVGLFHKYFVPVPDNKEAFNREVVKLMKVQMSVNPKELLHNIREIGIARKMYMANPKLLAKKLSRSADIKPYLRSASKSPEIARYLVK